MTTKRELIERLAGFEDDVEIKIDDRHTASDAEEGDDDILIEHVFPQNGKAFLRLS